MNTEVLNPQQKKPRSCWICNDKSRRNGVIVTLLLLFVCTGTMAADGPANKLEIPPPPPPLLEGNGENQIIPEPEVTIIHQEDRIIEEYRVNGQLRYAKITPSKGPAYYMIDTDGDGLLDTRDDNLDNPPINQWILWQW